MGVGGLGYRPQLDGLRAVAVSGVVAVHLGVVGVPDGGIGVFVFFVLSGFLITTLLLDEHLRAGRVSLGAFFLRRAARLLPGLVLVLAVTLLYAAVAAPDPVARATRSATLPVLLYVANWLPFRGQDLGMLFHTWSLGVEEQFYLLWPAVLLLALRRRARQTAIIGWLLLASLLSVQLRAATVRALDDRSLLVGTHLVADQLLIGCALAVLLHDPVRRVRLREPLRSAFPLSLVTLVAIACFTDAGGDDLLDQQLLDTLGVALVGLASAVVIGHLVVSDVRGPLASRPLVALGRMSYGVYLWHVPVLYALHASTPLEGWAWQLSSVVVTLVVAAASYGCVERPVGDWMRARVRHDSSHNGHSLVSQPERSLLAER